MSWHEEEGASPSKQSLAVEWLLAVAFPAGLIVVLIVYTFFW